MGGLEELCLFLQDRRRMDESLFPCLSVEVLYANYAEVCLHLWSLHCFSSLFSHTFYNSIYFPQMGLILLPLLFPSDIYLFLPTDISLTGATYRFFWSPVIPFLGITLKSLLYSSTWMSSCHLSSPSPPNQKSNLSPFHLLVAGHGVWLGCLQDLHHCILTSPSQHGSLVTVLCSHFPPLQHPLAMYY